MEKNKNDFTFNNLNLETDYQIKVEDEFFWGSLNILVLNVEDKGRSWPDDPMARTEFPPLNLRASGEYFCCKEWI